MVLWWQIVVTVVCIFLSGTFSGLTLGLMSLDIIDLRVLSQSGTDSEKWYALRILPVRQHGNWLLCTLLIGNTAVNAALAIVTADIFGGIAGLFASTAVILYIGEIIPQAVCHRFGLVIGAYAIPFVRVLMYLTAPLSFTTAKALDFFLGGESATRYNRSQLKSLVSMHGRARSDPDLPSLTTNAAAANSDPMDGNLPPQDGARHTIIDLQSEQNFSSASPRISISGDATATDGRNANDTTTTSATTATSTTCTNNNECIPTDADNDANSAEHRNDQQQNSTHRMHFNPLSKLRALAMPRSSHATSHVPKSRKERKHKGDKSQSGHAPLSKDEMVMLDGAFDFSQKKVGQVMTSLDDVFMLDASLALNFKVLLLIFQSGHSRIPVYEHSRDNIIGLIFAKDLILLDPEDSVPIRTVLSFFSRNVLLVMDDTPLNKMLNIFCQGGGHMAIVRKEQPSQEGARNTIGVVTLEDLIEELIGQDIVDETDVYTDNLSKQRVRRLRSIDPEVLKMFDSKHHEEILSDKEVLAVASYLSNNTHEFSEQFIGLDVLRTMLAGMPLIECHKHSESNGAQELAAASVGQSSSPGLRITNSFPESEQKHDDATIYTKGVPTKNAYLIIHGRLEIVAGDEGFVSEAGAWTVLGLRALTDDLYAPDFTAKVLERPTRLLRIPRKLYRVMAKTNSCNQLPKTEGEAERVRKEIRLESESLSSRLGKRRDSSASRSSPSLALAAAATAVAVGRPHAEESDGTSFDTSVVNHTRSIRDGQSLEWSEIEAHMNNRTEDFRRNTVPGDMETDFESDLDSCGKGDVSSSEKGCGQPTDAPS